MGWEVQQPTGRWKGVYRDANGRERSKTFDLKRDAVSWWKEQEGRIARGEWIDPAGPKTPWEDIVDRWLKNKVSAESTLERLESITKNHIRPAFQRRAIGAVIRSDVQGWVKGLSLKLAPSSVEVAYRYMSNVFSTAVKDGVIPKTPCVDIVLPEVTKPRVKPLLTEQVEALIAAHPPRYRAMLMLGAGAGLRQGEAFGVTVPAVSFGDKVLHVEQQLQQLIGRPLFLKEPKRGSVRDVPLPDELLDVLSWHMLEFPPKTLLTGVRGEDEPLLFTTDGGVPIRRTKFAEVWGSARRAAKLPVTVTFHDLRHYYASLLIAKGHDVKAVQARLGHKTAQETLETYGHLWPDTEDRTRAAVAAELGRAASLCSGLV